MRLLVVSAVYLVVSDLQLVFSKPPDDFLNSVDPIYVSSQAQGKPNHPNLTRLAVTDMFRECLPLRYSSHLR